MPPAIGTLRAPWMERVAALFEQLKAARRAGAVYDAAILEQRLNRELERHVPDETVKVDVGGA